MKRLCLVLSLLGLVGCKAAVLEDRPYACDHTNADGGVQCNAGWTCGFDDRCFNRESRSNPDAGRFVELWRCTDDTHCPNAWQCSQEVSGLRYCQQLGVGAPTPCADNDGGCQAGWRCGGTHRCFDPTDTVDAGNRLCTADDMCPTDFRCGEPVPDRPRLCLAVGLGGAASCLSDDGCEGGWRCDLFNHRCVEITASVITGHTGALTATRLSPLLTMDTPLRFAMTRQGVLAPAWSGAGATQGRGVMMASLMADGGLRVALQLRDEERQVDAGVRSYFERVFPVPGAPADVTDLVLDSEGPVVRFADAGVSFLMLDGGGTWLALPPADFLRQRDSTADDDTTDVLRVRGGTVNLGVRDDGGLTVPGVTVQEVVVIGRLRQYYLFTDGGLREAMSGSFQSSSPVTFGSALAAGVSPRSVSVAGPIGPSLVSVVAEVPVDGGAGSVGFIKSFPSFSWRSTGPLLACPDGSAPLQLSIADAEGGNPTSHARCSVRDGSNYPAETSLNAADNRFFSVVEDPVPWVGPVVAQRGGPSVRAHAGPNGRVWHVSGEDAGVPLGGLPLRPLVLDRKPEAVLSFYEPGAGLRIFAQSQGFLFGQEPSLGFVAQLKPNEVSPVASLGGLDRVGVVRDGLVVIESDHPRTLALMPGTATFTPPVTGLATPMVLDGLPRTIVLVACTDSVWAADVTDALASPFAQPAVFQRVLVPVPGVNLRSMALEPAASGIAGYLTTNSQNLRFGTLDLQRWALSPVPTPAMDGGALPLAVWSEADGAARTGFSDGRVWALPVMVPLTAPLVAPDGGQLPAVDYARKCGDVFVATREGLYRAGGGGDAGLPRWDPLPQVNAALDTTRGLELFESRDLDDRLFVATPTGLMLELTSPTRCP